MKLEPKEIFAEYRKIAGYNEEIGLYDTVERNENFFVGKQWEGVKAENIDKPIFNILKRVVNYFISMIVSDDVGVSFSNFRDFEDENKEALTMISGEISEVMELTKIKDKNRDCLRNAAVDGDACLYFYYDPDESNGRDVEGQIKAEVVDNTNVFFGNYQVCEVERQPYILIMMRKTVDEVKRECDKKSTAEGIKPDSDEYVDKPIEDDDKVSVILKLWRDDKTKTIHMIKVTQDVVVKDKTDTGLKRYPIAYMSWDKIKNSFHGQAAITGLIPNQIYINKSYAMAMETMKACAFPKIIYDGTKFPNGYSNKVGEAIAVQGDPNQALLTSFKPPEMSGQVTALIADVMSATRDTMGASDAALGNVRPDNTSAIIAVQQAASMPLELHRMAFYQFVEDYIRIMIDMMRNYYGTRRVAVDIPDQTGAIQRQYVLYDFKNIDGINLKLNVEIGKSAYWSETMQVQTIDNLYKSGIITSPVTYLESIPDGYIKNKQKILEKMQQQEQMQQMQQMMQQMPQGGGMGLGQQMPQMPY